ncbi:Protein of unknown function [Alteromonadaceae bacterium Bs31]|nr:Protein of unknown function [Alteromonadaceae bacterium Bs31]
MYKRVFVIAVLLSMFAGCASVPTEDKETEDLAKKFNPPSEGKSGLYIYRHGNFGGALKKDVWVDGECVGETAPNIFFYHEVAGDEEHKISTESEFSPNDLVIKTTSGENHFVKQYIKMGAFVGGAGLEEEDAVEGKEVVSKLKMAKKGSCSK